MPANRAERLVELNETGTRAAFISNADLGAPPQFGPDFFLRDIAAGTTTLASQAPLAANTRSFEPDVSGDGRHVAFVSAATNLDNTNVESRQVFVRDRQTGQIQLASTSTAGVPGVFGGSDPSLSATGRFVAFASTSTNLIPVDSNGPQVDVFVKDTATGVTSVVSVNSVGVQSTSRSDQPSISADGRFVAFRSIASNVVPGDTNAAEDIFVHDRATGATTRVSVSSTGDEANARSGRPSISADGRFVAFESLAANLVPGDANGANDVFVHDRNTGETTRVSTNAAGNGGNASSFSAQISDDGSIVAFLSAATDLDNADTNAAIDVFVHDRNQGVTERPLLGLGGTEPDDRSTGFALSGNGRFVAVSTLASNAFPGGTGDFPEIVVYDRSDGSTALVSESATGGPGDDFSITPAVSTDGSVVVFASDADTLIPGLPGPGAADGQIYAASVSYSLTCDGRPVTITGSGVINGTGGPDVILGSNGPDTITGFGGDDVICGMGGNDVIVDFAGDDVAFGGAGNDRISLGNGNDTAHGGPGDDVLRGENNDDTLFGDSGDDDLVGGADDDVMEGGPGDDRFRGGPGLDTAEYRNSPGPVSVSVNDTADDGTGLEADNVTISVEVVNGSVFDDVLIGSNTANTMRGNLGNDRLVGRGGNDRLFGGPGDDLVLGGADDDLVHGGGGVDRCIGAAGTNTFNLCEADDTTPADPGPAAGHPSDCRGLTPTITGAGVINGTAGDDVILGSPGNDVITGFGGNDVLCGGEGNDLLIDFSGDDILDGGDGNDRLFGGNGRDRLFGGSGHDVLKGEGGTDTLDGGPGNDDHVGGDANDVMRWSEGDDRYRGGPGDDTVDYRSVTTSVLVFRGSGADDGPLFETDDVQSSVETILGGSAGDVLIGANTPDAIVGGGGNDRIVGRGGDDALFGEDGNDFILGGADDDDLNGGDANDRCIGAAGTDTTTACEIDQP